MPGPSPNTINFLLQKDVLEEFLPDIGKKQWQPLHEHSDDGVWRFGLWCALMDEKAASRAMTQDGWDLHIGTEGPGFSQHYEGDKKITTYYRNPNDGGIRPMLIHREFNGAVPDYYEVNEEFRLYHNLAEDRKTRNLLAFDQSGRPIEIVQFAGNSVKASLKYLRQFQAGTQLHLAIFIDSVRYSNIRLEEIPPDERKRADVQPTMRWHRSFGEPTFKDGFSTLSRFLGKVILAPPSPDKAGIWPYDENLDDQPVSFIIGVDEEGRDILSTSEHEKLANYFGANPDAPHHLTPVYFRREVLAKYYAEPDRYQISDGRLQCLSLWSCQIDNDLEDCVVVFLGDLGRDLPYPERLHWRAFNIQPQKGISETNFRRSILAQFTDPKSEDLNFRHEYAETNRLWVLRFGWPLFLAPSTEDIHLLQSLRVPVSNSQAELDDQIGVLAKLLVDSLNEKDISKQANSFPEGAKGITKFENFLGTTKFPDTGPLIQLLRDIQSLRSSGSAHRKGSEYNKMAAKLGLDPDRKADIVRNFLAQANEQLKALQDHYS